MGTEGSGKGMGGQTGSGHPSQQSCQDLGYYGACDGDTLYYCDGQNVVQEDCAGYGGTCGQIYGNEDDGMNCITMDAPGGDSDPWEEVGSDSDSDDFEFYGDNSFDSWGMDG